MTLFRSAIFACCALAFSILLAIVLLPALLLPRKTFQRLAAVWCRGLIGLLRVCCGLRWRVIGREHLPPGAAILAAKHQSAWDTLIFHVLLEDPIYVLKQELLAVPLFGWYLRKAGNIAIDRSAGFRAIRLMTRAVDRALAEGATVIVFPEGTRAAPGARMDYQPGIAALYSQTQVPVIPIALNSGLYWPRRHFNKRAGVITVEILPAMPSGLNRSAFLSQLERRIEEATTRLCRESTRAADSRQ